MRYRSGRSKVQRALNNCSGLFPAKFHLWMHVPRKKNLKAGVAPFFLFSRKKKGMRGPSKRSQPVSRELARIIRDSSRLEGHHTLNENLRAVSTRQAKALEFYLRACALRLEQAL